jgi:L-fuconate dehydratase
MTSKESVLRNYWFQTVTPDVPVVPHVGDMGQIHQHLVLFNHVALGHEVIFLGHIPHLRSHFVNPAQIRDGVYEIPQAPGISCDLVDAAAR